MSALAVCTRCHQLTITETVSPGGPSAAFVLLFFGLLPGLLHESWRRAKARSACRACGSTQVVPPDSPRAKAILGPGCERLIHAARMEVARIVAEEEAEVEAAGRERLRSLGWMTLAVVVGVVAVFAAAAWLGSSGYLP